MALVLRVKDGLSIDNKRVHAILKEHDNVIENSNKQGRKRPWVQFKCEYSLVTAHIDWYQNDRGEWCIAVEDDATLLVFGMIETQSPSSAKSVEVLDEERRAYKPEFDVPILEVITNYGSEFINTGHDERPCPDHAFEGYLYGNNINTSSARLKGPGQRQTRAIYQTYE